MSSSVQLKQLQLRNFLSFGNNLSTIDLSYFGSTLIIGENIDTGSNNGSGKTTIINALCYALYNKPLDNIALQRIINSTNNVKNTLMEVILTFSKGDNEYEIYRCRGETYNIQITMNDKDITLDSVSENDALIEELIGISYDLFTKIVIFSGNSLPFLVMPVAQQRQQIEELFNITLLTEKALKLKELIKITENDINVQQAVIREQESAINLYNKQLTEAKERITRWDNETLKEINNLKNKLELVETIDMSVEKELHDLSTSLTEEKHQVEKKFSANKKDKTILFDSVNKLTNEIKHLHDDKCPYCLQKYAGAADKLIEAELLLKNKSDNLNHVTDLLLTLSNELTDIQTQQEDISKLIKFDTLADAVKAESVAQTAQQKIDELSSEINPYIEVYDKLKKSAVKEIDYKVIDDLKKLLDHQHFLLKLLTDKNSFIRRRIIKKTIPFLNNRLIHYTKELGLPHLVKFDDDMSCTVSEYGRELDFGNLSSGEKKRVNLSLSLAFRDVLHHLHAKINCLFIDEIDASLDASGVEQVFKLLKNKARDDNLSLWIISHRPEAKGRFDRSMIIRKQNGFSSVVSEESDEFEE